VRSDNQSATCRDRNRGPVFKSAIQKSVNKDPLFRTVEKHMNFNVAIFVISKNYLEEVDFNLAKYEKKK